MIVKRSTDTSGYESLLQFEDRTQVVERYLRSSLKTPSNDLLSRQGKKIRSEIIQLSYTAGGGVGNAPQALTDFIELLHAGSLVIDDIQDNATSRRGEQALHVRYGIPIAINTANWMYFEAFEKLNQIPLTANKNLVLLRQTLAVVKRCHEGQALDLSLRFDQLDQQIALSIVEEISMWKTGALTGLAAWLGAFVAGCDPIMCQRIESFGRELGVGLQMQNDFVELQKTAYCKSESQDLENFRVTWPWAWLSISLSTDEYQQMIQLAKAQSQQTILAKQIAEQIEMMAVSEISQRLEDSANKVLDLLPSSQSRQRLNRLIETLELRYV